MPACIATEHIVTGTDGVGLPDSTASFDSPSSSQSVLAEEVIPAGGLVSWEVDTLRDICSNPVFLMDGYEKLCSDRFCKPAISTDSQDDIGVFGLPVKPVFRMDGYMGTGVTDDGIPQKLLLAEVEMDGVDIR